MAWLRNYGEKASLILRLGDRTLRPGQNAGQQDAKREYITGDDSLTEYCVLIPDVLIFGAVKCLKEVKSRFWFTSGMLFWCVLILRIRTKSANSNNYKRTKITIWHVIIIFLSEIAILVRFSFRNYWSRVELHFWCVFKCSNGHFWCGCEVFKCTKITFRCESKTWLDLLQTLYRTKN